MAEDEIRKHAEAVYKTVKDPKKGLKHKLKEIIVEIAIIVFAVTISIWFHNWSESWKDRREEKEFLTGLRADIKADLEEMESDRRSCKKALRGVNYFLTVGNGGPFCLDSLNIYQLLFFGEIQVNPRISRFEALKGSGKLDIIENKELLLDIADLYAKDFPQLNRVNNFFNSLRNNLLGPYIFNHLQMDQKGNANWEELLHTSAMRLMIRESNVVSGSIDAYTVAIEKGKLIIKEIDEELK